MKNIAEVLRLHLKLELSLRKSAILNRVSLGTVSSHLKRFSELNVV